MSYYSFTNDNNHNNDIITFNLYPLYIAEIEACKRLLIKLLCVIIQKLIGYLFNSNFY